MKRLQRLLEVDVVAPEQPSIPEGHRIYAVGDVHGHDQMLGDLLSAIECDAQMRDEATITIVFLGDLIDRGPNSSAVLNRLWNFKTTAKLRTVFLAGNHEEILLRILRGEDELVPEWLAYGGAEFVRSYGLDPAHIREVPAAAAGQKIRELVPAADKSFLEGFVDTFRAGDYLFVHAGIRPGVALEKQSQTDLRWIRSPFIDDRRPLPFVVVHGHTISSEVYQGRWRIGIDTGAYCNGTLTALGLQGKDRWVLQVSDQQER